MTLSPPSLAITFFYYRDLAAACAFYEDVLRLELAIDQGWARIYRLAGAAHLGLVDEARGAHRAADPKPVQLCLRVEDLQDWHVHLARHAVPDLGAIRTNADLGLRLFTCTDPEGYQIEIQTPIAP